MQGEEHLYASYSNTKHSHLHRFTNSIKLWTGEMSSCVTLSSWTRWEFLLGRFRPSIGRGGALCVFQTDSIVLYLQVD